ncbi:Regulatory protein RecX [wastewater metagenome]|uniref:Regulatory protein RecX n=2 Tax=unclassified sequences TaxID=12908 RepID=A0A5B8RHY1_9ZZZZ|nr:MULTISPECIES: regulatory protein RecX [Arhodomonas]QEA07124.1 regulatory protein RecX [uncultured organism]
MDDGDDGDLCGEVRERAVRLLARREHSRRELCRKLEQRGYDADLVGEVVETLAGERLVSDERFAGEYVRSRSAQGYGPLRIRAELARRGVDDALIDPHLPDEDFWLEQLRAIHDKRFGPRPPEGLREKARRGRYLSNRGFSADQVRRVLGGLADDE